MPALLEGLLALVELHSAVAEDLGREVVADDADLIVVVALEASVANRVDMQGRVLWLSGELTELVAENLLIVIGEAILRAEKDHTALGHFFVFQIAS